MQRQFLGRRAQMAFVGLGLWLLLALWSLSAFWHHIDGLNESYRLAAKCGAMAGEFALLSLVVWHCFDKHIGVRRWSLIFSFLLGSVIIIHAGALRGLAEATAVQIDAEKRLAETLTKMSKEQMESTRRKADVAKGAQKEVADTVRSGADKVKDSSTLPRWYLDGWMYSVIFILSLALVGVIFLLMMNKDDIDVNFDGIPDRLQREIFPDEIEVENRSRARRENFTPKSDSERQSLILSQKQSRVSLEDGVRKDALKRLREHLKQIAFYHPNRWFKADLVRGGVTIRLFERQHGHEICLSQTTQSDKLLAAVDRPDFRDRLIEELRHQGFEI
jgi:hypothetical protein